MKPKNTTKEPGYTPYEAAKIKGCAESTLFLKLERGEIPGAYKERKEMTLVRDMWVIPHSALDSIVVTGRGKYDRKVKNK